MLRRLCAVILVATVLFGLAGAPVAGAQELELESQAAVLMDATSGEVLVEKNPDDPLPPASVTKLMTLLLVFEALEEGTITLDEKVLATADASSLGGSQIWLEPGEIMPVEDLIRAVAVRSANDAAAALAEHVAGTQEAFVSQMNQRARELGMKNTHFANAHGLYHPEHLMSARDVAILSRQIVTEHPAILDYTGRWEDRIREAQESEQWLVNTNKLIRRYEGVDGLKTGWTGPESGWCVSATAQRGNTRFIAVILKGPASDVRFAEAIKLLNYGFANFESVKIADAGAVLGTIPVDEGTKSTVDAILKEPLGVTVRKGQAEKLQKQVQLDALETAPVRQGDTVGKVIIMLDNQPLSSADLVAGGDVARISLLGLLFRNMGRAWPVATD